MTFTVTWGWMVGLAGFLAIVLIELLWWRHEAEAWEKLCDHNRDDASAWREFARDLAKCPCRGKSE